MKLIIKMQGLESICHNAGGLQRKTRFLQPQCLLYIEQFLLEYEALQHNFAFLIPDYYFALLQSNIN